MIKHTRQLFVVALFFVVILPSVQAQNLTNYKHYTFWSRITVAKIWQKKWELLGEYQHRRQNYNKASLNLMESHLLHSARIRLRYIYNKNVTFSLLPFTYFYASPLLGNEADYLRTPDKEIRLAAQIELIHEFGKLSVLNRYGYESRWIKRSTDDHFIPAGRIRYRLLLERPIIGANKNQEFFRPYASSELFLNTGKNIQLPQVFEHIRFSAGVRMNISPHLRLDTGYQYARRLRRSGKEGDHEHSLVTHLSIIL